MKLMFASDIHGNLHFCNKLKECYEKEEPDKLILLGDLLYNKSLLAFGRNNERQKTAGILNDLMEYIIAVRGNCDTDLDQDLLYFPMMSDYKKLNVDGYELFITHGHLYNKYHLPSSNKKVILIHGHTHIPCIENTKEYMYLNPGSVLDPRQGTPHTYMIYKEKEFIIKDLEGKEINSIKLDECY